MARSKNKSRPRDVVPHRRATGARGLRSDGTRVPNLYYVGKGGEVSTARDLTFSILLKGMLLQYPLYWRMTSMQIRYYLDSETGVPHIHDHGVVEYEVEEVLRHPGEDRRGRDDSRVALGQTQAGRYLRVIYVPDPIPNSVFVITAYELQGKPLAAYRRRKRKKPK